MREQLYRHSSLSEELLTEEDLLPLPAPVATATTDIRLFGLIPIVKQAGQILEKTETVTLFNDMCLMAPATLIDKRIRWEEIDNTTSRAIYTNRGITITAKLCFNQEGATHELCVERPH